MLRIKSLQVFDHILLKDCVFNFCSEENDIGEPFFSIVIGVNGTGKSRLLKSILEIFIHLTEFKEKGKYKRFPNSFYIEYSIKEYNFQIEYKYNIISIKRNKTEISINELEIPTKFLAVTTSLYDRFPKYNSKHSLAKERYKYLGIRAASNNAFIGMQTSKTAEFIAEIISQNKNIETLKFLFSKLDIGSNIKLIFKKGRNYNKITDWFNNNKSISIRNIFQQITPEQQNSPLALPSQL